MSEIQTKTDAKTIKIGTGIINGPDLNIVRSARILVDVPDPGALKSMGGGNYLASVSFDIDAHGNCKGLIVGPPNGENPTFHVCIAEDEGSLEPSMDITPCTGDCVIGIIRTGETVN